MRRHSGTAGAGARNGSRRRLRLLRERGKRHQADHGSEQHAPRKPTPEKHRAAAAGIAPATTARLLDKHTPHQPGGQGGGHHPSIAFTCWITSPIASCALP